MVERNEAKFVTSSAPQAFGVLIGPLAFAADLLISYSLVPHACSTGHYYVIHVVSVICLLLALSGAFVSWRQYGQVRQANDEGGSPFDRAHFFALLGIVTSAWFTVVIIANAVPRFVLSPCD